MQYIYTLPALFFRESEDKICTVEVISWSSLQTSKNNFDNTRFQIGLKKDRVLVALLVNRNESFKISSHLNHIHSNQTYGVKCFFTNTCLTPCQAEVFACSIVTINSSFYSFGCQVLQFAFFPSFSFIPGICLKNGIDMGRRDLM